MITQVDSKLSHIKRIRLKKPKKQTVKTGERSGENIEILEGLKAGKKILAEKPKD